MVRTQIQLTEAQFEALKARAASEGRSMAGLIRASVDDSLRRAVGPTREERRQRALGVVGRFGKGPADLSHRHDDYLAQAYR